MIHNPNNLVLLLGRLHPLVVHLPIGGLVLLGFLELRARLGNYQNDLLKSNRTVVGFVCGTTVLAALCGWTLASSGDYRAGGLLAWHQWLGVVLAVVCLATFLARMWLWIRTYHILLCLALMLLLVVGHLGGSITHGRDFLTRYIPPFPSPSLALAAQPFSTQSALQNSLHGPVYSSVVQPILRQHCVSCHNPQKHKADLRLDTFQALRAGGLDGPVIKAGHAEESRLIQSMLSASDADGHMPPEGQPQAALRDIDLLVWWINAGAPESAPISELHPSAEIIQLLEGRSAALPNQNGPRLDQ